jgi:hypothetical protein
LQPDGDDTFDGLQDYDSETEVDYYDDLEDVTVYDEVPKMRFMFFRVSSEFLPFLRND